MAGEENKTEYSEQFCTRNDPTFILEQMWGALVAFVAILFGNQQMIVSAFLSLRTQQFIYGLAVLIGIIFVFFLICLFYVNRWYKTTITVVDGMLISEQKTMLRRKNSIALSNISNINLEQNLFERLIGTYKLKLDTNSLSTAEQTDVKIVLNKQRAEQLKQLIMQRVEKAEELERESSSEEQQVVMEKEFDITYTPAQIFKNALFNTSIALILATIAAFLFTIFAVMETMGSIKSIGSALFGIVVQAGVLLSLVKGLLDGWLKDYHFQAKRNKDQIYVQSGLLKKVEYTIPLHKIQAVSFSSTCLSRMFGRYYVEVINVGGEGEDATGRKILLMGKEKELKDKLAILLPEYPYPEAKEMKKQPVCMLLWHLIWAVILGGMISAGAIWGFEAATHSALSDRMLWGILLMIGIGMIGIVIACLSYLTVGLYIDEDYLILERGCFGKNRVTLPYKNMQYIKVTQGIFGKLFHVSTAQIQVLASAVNSSQSTRQYPTDQIDQIVIKFQQKYHRKLVEIDKK